MTNAVPNSSPPVLKTPIGNSPVGHPRLAKSVWPLLLLLFIGVSWGAAFSLAKMATEGGAHPLGIAYWQSLIGAVLLISFSVIARKPIMLNRQYIVIYVVCGLLGSVIPGILYFYAASHVSPGVLAITIATVPIFTFVGAVALRVERGSFLRIAGVLFGIGAIILLVGPTEGLPDRSMIPWILGAIVAAICYSGENLVIAIRLPKDANSFLIVGGMFVAATLIMTPFVFATGTFVPLTWPWGRPECAIIGMAILSLICYGLFLNLIVRAGPVFASQTAYVITISGVFWGILIFHDHHSAWVWASLAVMLIALALVTPRKNYRR